MRYSYEDFLRELGAKLRQMRLDRGWTLRRMIVEYGFHLAQWQGFEKGKGMSVPTLLRLCELFDLSLEELIGGLGRTPSLPPPEVSLSKEPAKRPGRRTATQSPGEPRRPRAPRKA